MTQASVEKLCINCKHWQEATPQCKHPKNFYDRNYVNGQGFIPHYHHAQYLRMSSFYCGPDGKWFEAKSPIVSTYQEATLKPY